MKKAVLSMILAAVLALGPVSAVYAENEDTTDLELAIKEKEAELEALKKQLGMTDPETAEAAESTAADTTDAGTADTDPTAADDSTEVVEEPEGTEILLNEMVSSQMGQFKVMSSGFVDEAAPQTPAEGSLKMTAKAGKKMLTVRISYRSVNGGGEVIGDALAFKLIGAGIDDSKARAFVESADGEGGHCFFTDSELTEGDGSNYFVNATGLRRRFYSDNTFVGYDYVLEVPEEVETSGQPIYLSITNYDEQFYYEIQ